MLIPFNNFFIHLLGDLVQSTTYNMCTIKTILSPNSHKQNNQRYVICNLCLKDMGLLYEWHSPGARFTDEFCLQFKYDENFALL